MIRLNHPVDSVRNLFFSKDDVANDFKVTTQKKVFVDKTILELRRTYTAFQLCVLQTFLIK